MSPTGLAVDKFLNNLFQNRWIKQPLMLSYFHNDKRDFNGHSSSSNGDSSGFGSGGSGSSFNSGSRTSFNGGSGSSFNGGSGSSFNGGSGSSFNGGSGSSFNGGSGSNFDGNGDGSSSNDNGHGNNSGSGNNGDKSYFGSSSSSGGNGDDNNFGSSSSSSGNSNFGSDSSGNSNNNNFGSASSGNSNNNNSKSVSGGKSDSNNDAGGGTTQFKTITATFSTSSTTPTGDDSLASITSFIIPSTTLDSPAPSSTLTVLSPTEQQAIRHVALPLGSIVAIILGTLFCITIAGVIYVVTRPKFGSLGRLWRNSRVSAPYLPSIASYEPKEFRDSSNLYRPYRPQGAQDLSSFRFGSQGGIAGNRVHRTGNNGTSLGGFSNFQTQIYSTSKPGSTSPKAERSLASSHAGESEDDSLESLNRIMSMMDRYHFERNSAVDSGQISPNPSERFHLNDNQQNHSDYPHSVGPETTSGE